MSWLDWQEELGDVVGGEYRVRLEAPFQWEVLLAGEHLLFHESRASALDEAEAHFRERLRRKDMVAYGIIVLLAGAAMFATAELVPLDSIWSILLFALFVHIGLTSLGRFTAAATRNRFDPYRRRAPWEPRGWWHR